MELLNYLIAHFWDICAIVAVHFLLTFLVAFTLTVLAIVVITKLSPNLNLMKYLDETYNTRMKVSFVLAVPLTGWIFI